MQIEFINLLHVQQSVIFAKCNISQCNHPLFQCILCSGVQVFWSHRQSFGCDWSHICITFVTSTSLANHHLRKAYFTVIHLISLISAFISAWDHLFVMLKASLTITKSCLNPSTHSYTLFCAMQCSPYCARFLTKISDMLTCYDHKKQITVHCSTMVKFKAVPLFIRRFVNKHIIN